MVNKLISKVIPVLPKQLVWIFSKRYIAGSTLNDAIRVTQNLNKEGYLVTLDILGEDIKDLAAAESYKKEYISSIVVTQEIGLDCSYSLKPSMFGLKMDQGICLGLIEEVIKTAAVYKKQIILDMEGSDCTDSEMDLFSRLYEKYPASVGFVLQAYLKRTATDIEKLKKMSIEGCPINLRLCKGIYIEPETISFKNKIEVREHYMKDAEALLQGGFYAAYATHDIHLVNAIYKMVKQKNIPNTAFEFQMLYGVKPELRKKIISDGYSLRVYVPFGKEWFGYSTRRLKENPKVISHIIKSLFVRG
jgi:proline dehydrogenase